jgi:hypothetical protein
MGADPAVPVRVCGDEFATGRDATSLPAHGWEWSMTHTVTITRLPDDHNDDYESTFGGSHGNDCTVLLECKRKACQAMNPDYGDERVRHGREHQHRDGIWLVESDLCALRYVFESRTEWETFEGIPLGTYPVRVEWEDNEWWVEVQYTQPTVQDHTDGSGA